MDGFAFVQGCGFGLSPLPNFKGLDLEIDRACYVV
jgi:hypothetical protein